MWTHQVALMLLLVGVVFIHTTATATETTESITTTRATAETSATTTDTETSIHLPNKIYKPRHNLGNLLEDMEWVRGSDDISAELDAKAHVLSAVTKNNDKMSPPGRMFGVYSDDLGQPKTTHASAETTINTKHSEQQLAAQLVRSFSEVNDPDDQGSSLMMRQYEKFLIHNPQYVEHLRELFSELDLNGDGAIDDHELELALQKGYLSRIGVRALKTWDVNFSQKISWQEFQTGPLFLAFLDSKELLMNDFNNDKPGVADRVTQYFRRMIGTYKQANPAAFGLIEESVSMHRSQAQAQTQTHTQTETSAEAEAQVHEQLRASAELQATAAALESLGMTMEEAQRRGLFDTLKNGASALVNGVKGLFGKGKKKEPEDPRPVSKFGVPSEKDETCVMCQYVMERVAKELETKVVDDYTAFDDLRKSTEASGGFPGVEQTTGRLYGGRRRANLFDLRGHRTPTRMIKEITEVIMKKTCGDTAPVLFKDGCKKIWEVRSNLAYGLYRRLGAGGNCQESKICGAGTYFSENASVHTPMQSMKVNGARELCGMLGGANERQNKKVSKGMCALKSLFRPRKTLL